MKIAIEYILWLQEERNKINRVPLDEIEFYENGMKVKIDKAILEEFTFTGLINVDFITSGFYETGFYETKFDIKGNVVK